MQTVCRSPHPPWLQAPLLHDKPGGLNPVESQQSAGTNGNAELSLAHRVQLSPKRQTNQIVPQLVVCVLFVQRNCMYLIICLM